MRKKIFAIGLLSLVLFLVACKSKEFKVTFDSMGGSAVEAQTVKSGGFVAEPNDPTKASNNFMGWFTNPDAEGAPFSFEATKVTKKLTLYAGWTTDLVVRLETRTANTVAPKTFPTTGGTLSQPETPTRDGFRFGGWFNGRAGLTWTEPEAVSFPLAVTANTRLFAYWEPLNSKTITYSKDETYTSSMLDSSSMVLNPAVYQWSHEDTLINMLVTALYSTEVDWDKAISQGIADFPGDFSKVESQEYSIEAFDYINILVGAARFPVDSEGDEHLTEDGKYDRAAANQISDTKWTFYLREDVYFEDGTKVNADTFEFTLRNYLDPVQKNYRADRYYKTADNPNGFPIKNAAEFNSGDIEWSEVGFTKVSEYVFTIETFEPVSQSGAVGFANIRLLHPEAYAASLDAEGKNSKYGTPTNPFVSYGPYIIKSWDANQKIVFNKNFEYVARHTINFKSQVIEIVSTIAQQTALFVNGELSVLGLSNENAAQFAEHSNLKRSWDGYPQYLIVNLAESKDTTSAKVEHPDILFDTRFRQALLYGFNRTYFASSVYAPNTASLLPIPLDARAYIQDPLYYSQSPQHLSVLESLSIGEGTNGYIPERAKQLFDAAYADWVADGNTGPVVLNYPASNSSTLAESLANYIKASYEELFGSDKLVIDVKWMSDDSVSAHQKNWNFDISLGSIGFGVSYGLQWQYPGIGFMGALLGAANLGLSQPFDMSQPDGYGAYLFEEIEVNLEVTYQYLLSIADLETTHEDYLYFLDLLKADTETGKPAGVYKGELYDLADIFINLYNPFDGTAEEPFPGATNDIWNAVAAFEEVFFAHAPLIPTVTRSSISVYQDNVVITWPAFSGAFGWGATRYRFLSSDPDWRDGFFFQ